MSQATFSASEWLRYTRHLQLPQIAVAGQQRLKNSKVLVVGAGGLGSPVLLYLAAAGVGQITIIDGDCVELTNLQRQIIFSSEQIGQPKAQCARERLVALNPEIEVVGINAYLTHENIQQWFDDKDLVIDCTDNFATRYLINDTCRERRIPWLFASIFRFSGQCALFTEQSACFRCLFPEAPQDAADCNDAGVLGVLPGLLGTLQANEAIKYLINLETPLENHLLLVEALDLSFRRIQLAKSSHCPQCGSVEPSVTDNGQINRFDHFCSSDEGAPSTITAKEWKAMADSDHSSARVLDVRSHAERSAFHLGGEWIPLDQLIQHVATFDKQQTLICYCQSGVRSDKAAKLLAQHGLNAKSVRGGIVEMLKSSLEQKSY
jgi:molybdopterin/thiamine biosynthesis adenylyltransferase/rhodanese-related sulfurtransferase